MGNFIDNIISYFNPKAGAERAAWIASLEELRSYDAGRYGRGNINWTAFNESGQQTDKYERDLIRARARDLERNSDMANAVIGAFKRNIVGRGFILRVNTGDKERDNAIEKMWKQWCRARNCDVTGQQSFNQILRMVVQRKKVDGGIIIKKCYTRNGILPFQMQVVEVDELYKDAPKNKSKNKVVDGIELDEYNRPVGYYIKQYDLEGMERNQPVFVPAKDIIFYYSKKRASQVREISDIAPIMTRIRDANEYMNAVSVKERIAACLAVFIKKTSPGGGVGRNGSTAKTVDYKGKRLTPGMIMELNVGDEVDKVDPTGQAGDSAGFVQLFQRLIGAGQGLSYEATSRDMTGSTYSSARQNIIEDELTYADDIELLNDIMTEIYETFLISAVITGKIIIPNFWEEKETMFQHEWIKAPKKWIDPKKEAEATKIALQSGQKTFQEVAAENGKDWQEAIDDMGQALAYAKSQGIEIGGVIYGQKKEELAV